MQPNNNQPSQAPQQNPPATSAHGEKVIQPVSDLSEYVNRDGVISQPVRPDQNAQNPHAQQPQLQPKRVDASKIYPDTSQPSSQTLATTDSNATQDKEMIHNQKVADRVPAIRVYSIFIIIYSLYDLYAWWSVVSLYSHFSQFGLPNSFKLQMYAGLVLVGIYIPIGIYLLLSKSVKMVDALLTALLILSGLNLLNSLITDVQHISHLSVYSVTSIAIQIGLFVYLWSVKSQVDLVNN